MYIVAIYNIRGAEDSLAKILASALGKTAYEMRARVHVPKGGPSVVASFAELKLAEDCAANLRANGFDTFVLSQDAIESDSTRFIVHSFELAEQGLHVQSRQGHSMTVAYRDIDLLLRGTNIARQTKTDTVRGRKFSMGRAALSGGIVITKTTKSTQQTITENSEGFLLVYAKEQPALVFRESAVLYESLGPVLQPSRAANFAHVLTVLRRRCPSATYDERLVTRAGQTQLLGPLLTPEEYMDVATSILARVLRTFKK